MKSCAFASAPLFVIMVLMCEIMKILGFKAATRAGLSFAKDDIRVPATKPKILDETQKEIDYYWKRLLAGGGRESACGWLKDKYGVSWQVDPPILMKLIQSKDPAKAKRVMEAMMKMVKIEIAKIEEAAR